MFHWLMNKLRRRKTIVVVPRDADIWVGLASKKGVWGCGPSVKTAIGSMILFHPEEFGINIQDEFGGRPAKPLNESYITINEKQYDTLMDRANWSRK